MYRLSCWAGGGGRGVRTHPSFYVRFWLLAPGRDFRETKGFLKITHSLFDVSSLWSVSILMAQMHNTS